MQISFDPRDENAATSALAVILALHPAIDSPWAVPADTLESFTCVAQADRLLEPDAPDPAEAFGGASAEQAFAAGPTVLPVADTAPAPAGSIPTPPSASAPASAPNPGGVEVDASGLPWDGRIHSGPTDKKPKNADLTWRKKRGASDDEVRAVEAELRAALGAPAAPVAEAPVAPVPPAPVVASPIPAPVAVVPTPAPVAPAPSPVAAATVPGPAAAIPAGDAPATTFAELMRKVTARQAAGVLTVEGTAQISAALGISGVRDLLSRPDLIPSFDMSLPDMPGVQ